MSSRMTLGVMVGIDVIGSFCADDSGGKEVGTGCFGYSSSMMWTGVMTLLCDGIMGLIFVDWILLRFTWR